MTKDEVSKQILDLVNKEKMKIGFDLSFPIYRILPDEVQLALKVLGKHGMKISLTINNK